jgi:acetyltransferase-like isoleucine patch superfamily enzyme
LVFVTDLRNGAYKVSGQPQIFLFSEGVGLQSPSAVVCALHICGDGARVHFYWHQYSAWRFSGQLFFAKEDSPIVGGDFTTIASNVCLGAFNHDVHDISQYMIKGGIHIGRYCWIGANAVVLSGVRLVDHTVVSAGAVVTRSCEEGYVVLGGKPARVVKRLDKERVVAFDHPWHYRGYTKVR